MKSTGTLKKNYEFMRVYRKGRYLPGRHAVIHFIRRARGGNRLGVTVGKGIKGSVRRNRLKRLLRESFRLMERRLASGYDIILVAKAGGTAPPFKDMDRDVRNLLARAGILLPEDTTDRAGSADEATADRPDPVL